MNNTAIKGLVEYWVEECSLTEEDIKEAAHQFFGTRLQDNKVELFRELRRKGLFKET